MSKREAIIRLTLILRKLKTEPASFEEILEFLRQEGEILSYDFFISKRTFQRDVQDVASIFNIEIGYDSMLKKYYLIEEYERSDRLLEAFDTFSALNTQERIDNVLFFENRKPLGLRHMRNIIHAAKNNRMITFNYEKYWEEIESIRTIKPCGLKEFNHRWYLVGQDDKDQKLKIFGLDRISKLIITNMKFIEPDFSVKNYFKYCFGIIRPVEEDALPQKVILSFDPLKGKYVKSLPLHSTQKILRDNHQELRIELELYLTHDFKMEILSHGHEVKILAPDFFRDQIKETQLKSLNR